ncbi:MAG TPA: ferredoxin reductase, partial [Candidatus Baltobacteraceae bacterium]|nr:ferredoxin reductase [Candidatus Baltobacteraceae bacterium]
MNWFVGSVTGVHDETPAARTIALDVAGWPGHVAGQHVDVRLTADDGYAAVRSYSIASAPDAKRVELTVVQIPQGEVSPYLTQNVAIGDPLEIRGPIGGWFVWRPTQNEHVQLLAGGSGLVPLMAMIRARAAAGSNAPFRLLYSLRNPESALYAAELQQRSKEVPVTYAYTREVPQGWPDPARHVDMATIEKATWPPSLHPMCYVCGPTAFVESAADLLRSAGHSEANIKTERFG